MALPTRTINDSATDHLADHNTLHAFLNARMDLLASAKSAADTPDDEFDSSTLDGKWTAVSGSSGTAALLTAGSAVTELYDLTTRPGWLIMQCGTGDDVALRQDYTLPDGSSIVLAVAVGTGETSGGDNQAFALRLNDDDSSSVAGEFVALMVEQDGTAFNIQGNSDTSSSGNEITSEVSPLSQVIFLRIARDGLTYSCFYSIDGFTWSIVYQDTHADIADNIWLHFGGPTTLDVVATVAIAWIRQGTNDLDPWPLGTS